jgi:F0F1-type ATP synthase alpha subunit
MQVTVTAVSDVRSDNRGVSSKIKCGNDEYYVNEDATPLIGKTVEITYEDKTSKKGNKYKIAKIVKVLEGVAPVNGNGKVTWENYKKVAQAAHTLALELEPDGPGESGIVVDRSEARVSLVQTILVALRDGKIELPEGDDDIPF